MKKIALLKPVGKIKSYSICVADEESGSVTPIIFLQKSQFLSDAEYEEAIKQLKITCENGYVPKLEGEN